MKRLLRKIKSASKPGQNQEFEERLRKILHYTPRHLAYFSEAFTHSSFKAKDDNGQTVSYERLEFLGDAILGSVVAGFLYEEFPSEDEGFLTQMRSKIVSREHLNELGKKFGLIDLVRSRVSRSKIGNNINGNLFEAMIGAIYLDKGYLFCEKYIHKHILDTYVDLPRLEDKISSYKSYLVEWSQKHRKSLKYDVYEDSGNEKQKHFSVRLYVDGKVISKGRSTSKKKAEEIASKRAYFVIQNR